MSAEPRTAPVDGGQSAELALGDALVAAGKLASIDLDRARSACSEFRISLTDALTQLGLVSEEDIAHTRAEFHRLPFVAAADFPQVWPAIEGVQPGFLAAKRVLPLSREDGKLRVAMADPADDYASKALRLASGLELDLAVALPSAIDKALAEQRDAVDDDGGDARAEREVDSDEFVEHLKDIASEAPVIRQVSSIISRVVDLRASDIHLEPFDEGLVVRYRVDGELETAETIAPRQGAAVASRIKLLAHLDIAERRLPQDGRIRTRVKGREIDLRVSTIPSVHGESVVMRVLDRTSVRLSLDEMRMPADTLAQFRDLLARQHGVLLVTGPTGEGKTTTLYAALSELDAARHKIVTVEDPVEYQLGGIVQIQVQAQIGLTFANALRSILRQDPDVIMVGEMRDSETAQIAVQAALTGHLVLSTLHTNDAASAVVRMVDMQVERFLITSAVNGVVAQRLVRSLCTACKQPFTPEAGWLEATGIARHTDSGAVLYKAQGCAACKGTGYQGRLGLFELMRIDDEMRSAIAQGADAAALKALAVRKGMRTLHEDGLRRVAAGVTTYEEVLRSTQAQRA